MSLLVPVPSAGQRLAAEAGVVQPEPVRILRTQLIRQSQHWSAATERLGDRTAFAAPAAWAALERYLGVALRTSLDEAVARLRAQALAVRAELAAARTRAELEAVRRRLVELRTRYLQAETLVTFYAHAVNCRTSPDIAAVLRACDVLAERCMRPLFELRGLPTPPVLTYVDKGLGASILRAGLRLWDGGTISEVAAIKVVWHNLLRPTAVLHEAGHHIGFGNGWNAELAAALGELDPVVGPQLAQWATEIGPDGIAFCASGYGSVTALHDVVAGSEAAVFLGGTHDVHPSGWLRVLIGVAFCRAAFGAGGPWNDLGAAWLDAHPLARAPASVRGMLERAQRVLPALAEAVLFRRYPAFRGRALADVTSPDAVRPDRLRELAATAGPALWTSQHWLTSVPLQLLALSTYQVAVEPERSADLLAQLRDWMIRLGNLAV